MNNNFKRMVYILGFILVVSGILSCGGGSSKTSDSDDPLVSAEKTASLDDFQMDMLLSDGVNELTLVPLLAGQISQIQMNHGIS